MTVQFIDDDIIRIRNYIEIASTTNINEMLDDLKNPNISYSKTLINWTKKNILKVLE